MLLTLLETAAAGSTVRCLFLTIVMGKHCCLHFEIYSVMHRGTADLVCTAAFRSSSEMRPVVPAFCHHIVYEALMVPCLVKDPMLLVTIFACKWEHAVLLAISSC